MIPYTLIIDESISEGIGSKFEIFLNKRNIQAEKTIYIAQKYPSMPDDRIIIHLLNHNSIILTKDRPFHNKVLEKGLKSYYYNGHGFYKDRLKGIKTVERIHKRDLILNNSYQHSISENYSIVRCLSEKQQKKMRTKRRRIRNYFGGLDHMSESAVTISLIPKGQGILIGIRIKISSNIDIKALDASENYFEEKLSNFPAGYLALCYGLILSLQLMLNQIKTTVYYDSQYITDNFDNSGEDITEFLKLLKKSFNKIDFIPTNKGFHMERVRRKLIDLKYKASNEIVPGYFENVMENYRSISVTAATADNNSGEL